MKIDIGEGVIAFSKIFFYYIGCVNLGEIYGKRNDSGYAPYSR